MDKRTADELQAAADAVSASQARFLALAGEIDAAGFRIVSKGALKGFEQEIVALAGEVDRLKAENARLLAAMRLARSAWPLKTPAEFLPVVEILDAELLEHVTATWSSAETPIAGSAELATLPPDLEALWERRFRSRYAREPAQAGAAELELAAHQRAARAIGAALGNYDASDAERLERIGSIGGALLAELEAIDTAPGSAQNPAQGERFGAGETPLSGANFEINHPLGKIHGKV